MQCLWWTSRPAQNARSVEDRPAPVFAGQSGLAEVASEFSVILVLHRNRMPRRWATVGAATDGTALHCTALECKDNVEAKRLAAPRASHQWGRAAPGQKRVPLASGERTLSRAQRASPPRPLSLLQDGWRAISPKPARTPLTMGQPRGGWCATDGCPKAQRPWTVPCEDEGGVSGLGGRAGTKNPIGAVDNASNQPPNSRKRPLPGGFLPKVDSPYRRSRSKARSSMLVLLVLINLSLHRVPAARITAHIP